MDPFPASSPSSRMKALSHTASWVASDSAMYSASVDERATVRCFLLSQLMQPPLSTNTYPLVLRRDSISPGQSASEYPTSSPSLDPKKQMPCDKAA